MDFNTVFDSEMCYTHFRSSCALVSSNGRTRELRMLKRPRLIEDYDHLESVISVAVLVVVLLGTVVIFGYFKVPPPF